MIVRNDQFSTISTYRFDAQEKTILKYQTDTSITLEYQSSIQFGDFNGDSNFELAVFQPSGINHFYAFNSTDKTIDFSAPVKELTTNRVYKNMGDLNADGIQDVFFFDKTDSTYAVGFGKQGELIEFDADVTFTINDYNRLVMYTKDFKVKDGEGNHLVLSYSSITSQENTTVYETKILSYNTETSLFDTSIKLSYMNSELKFYDRMLGSINLGHINGDEIEDFGILYSERGELHVFYGGILKTSADAIFSVRENDSDMNYYFTYSGISTGDINGDGYTDLLLSSQAHSFIRVFLGTSTGLDNQYDATIDVYDSNQSIYWLENVGDINKDGYDDFAVSTLSNLYDESLNGYKTNGLVKLIYGGTNVAQPVIKSLNITEELVTNYLTFLDIVLNQLEILTKMEL